MEPVFDNKENIPSLSLPHKPKGCLVLKKPALGCGRLRKPLSDITNLYKYSHLSRSSSLPDIESPVPSRTVVLNVRKRRALDDIDLAQVARAKSLRMGFR